MPKSRFQEIYQDYVCGCLLRVARETFALLPAETLIVTALTDLFDSRTGHTAERPIFSAAIPRVTLNGLNFERLDPSAAMDNFLHRGDFKASRRGGGFIPITPLAPDDLTAKVAAAQAGMMARLATAPPPTPSLNPFSAKWAEALRRNEVQSGFLRLTADSLAGLFGMAPMESYSLYESKELAQRVETCGYCVEPDPRHDARSYFGDQEVGIFQPSSGAFEPPSTEFLGASALLRLCVFVAAADGTVDDCEMDQFRQFLQGRFVLAPVELQRLAILKSLLTSGGHRRTFSLPLTPIRVHERKKLAVAQFLVDVAAADGVVSKHERQVLGRIFEALSLTEETLDTLLKNLATPSGEVRPNAGEQGSDIESLLPPAPHEPRQSSFKLDMARVAAISAETAEVITILASAMAEGEPATPPQSHPHFFSAVKPEVRPKPESMAASGAHSDSRLVGLPLKWHPIVQELAVRDAWIRADFERLAHQHCFMPLSVFEVVNEWADEHLGDFLLEGEDPVAVRRGLLPK